MTLSGASSIVGIAVGCHILVVGIHTPCFGVGFSGTSSEMDAIGAVICLENRSYLPELVDNPVEDHYIQGISRTDLGTSQASS